MKIINKLLLQWLFLRLTRCSEKIVTDFKPLSYDIMSDGNISARGLGIESEIYWYSIQGFIIPLSGYGCDFKYLGKPWFLKITKKEIKRT